MRLPPTLAASPPDLFSQKPLCYCPCLPHFPLPQHLGFFGEFLKERPLSFQRLLPWQVLSSPPDYRPSFDLNRTLCAGLSLSPPLRLVPAFRIAFVLFFFAPSEFLTTLSPTNISTSPIINRLSATSPFPKNANPFFSSLRYPALSSSLAQISATPLIFTPPPSSKPPLSRSRDVDSFRSCLTLFAVFLY